MPTQHYLLWATGEDQPGIVAGLTKILFLEGCNLEDSSMMRLGSEFGVLLIFTSSSTSIEKNGHRAFSALEKKFVLTIGLKKITSRQALYAPTRGPLHLVTVYGKDQRGFVYRVTQLLAEENFNITDLSAHRTIQGKIPGYILMIEGEISARSSIRKMENKLAKLGVKLNAKITIKPIATERLL